MGKIPKISLGMPWIITAPLSTEIKTAEYNLQYETYVIGGILI